MRQGNGSGVGRLWDDVQSMSSIVLKALIQALSLSFDLPCVTQDVLDIRGGVAFILKVSI